MEQAALFTLRRENWVTDTQVQAEIAYLDSTSNYREYLPTDKAELAKGLPCWSYIVLTILLFAVAWLFDA